MEHAAGRWTTSHEGLRQGWAARGHRRERADILDARPDESQGFDPAAPGGRPERVAEVVRTPSSAVSKTRAGSPRQPRLRPLGRSSAESGQNRQSTREIGAPRSFHRWERTVMARAGAPACPRGTRRMYSTPGQCAPALHDFRHQVTRSVLGNWRSCCQEGIDSNQPVARLLPSQSGPPDGISLKRERIQGQTSPDAAGGGGPGAVGMGVALRIPAPRRASLAGLPASAGGVVRSESSGRVE